MALTPTESRLLHAAATAHTVARPKAAIKLNDEVIVHGPRSAKPATVKKIGQAWLTVSDFGFRFRRDTLKSSVGYGSEYVIKTLDQHDYDRRLSMAKERLRTAGLAVSAISPPHDGVVLALAALVELLEENATRTLKTERNEDV